MTRDEHGQSTEAGGCEGGAVTVEECGSSSVFIAPSEISYSGDYRSSSSAGTNDKVAGICDVNVLVPAEVEHWWAVV